MKKLTLLLVAALLAACGGGGGGSSTTTSGTSTGGGGSVAKVTFNIVEPKTTARPAPIAGTPESWRRISVTNASLAFKEIKEWKVGDTPQTTFELLPTTGYTVEVLDYVKNTTYIPSWSTSYVQNVYSSNGILVRQTPVTMTYPATSPEANASGHTMTKYGITTFNVNSDGSATIDITLNNPQVPELTYPLTKAKFFGYSGVPSSANRYGFNNISTVTYKVKATFPASSPLNTSNWGLKRSTSATAVSNATALGITGDTTSSLIGPYVTKNNSAREYAMGLFFAKSSLLNTGEAADFFILPSATVSSPVVYNAASVTIPNP